MSSEKIMVVFTYKSKRNLYFKKTEQQNRLNQKITCMAVAARFFLWQNPSARCGNMTCAYAIMKKEDLFTKMEASGLHH